MQIIFSLLICLVVIIAMYLLIRTIITLYSGCSKNDADQIIQDTVLKVYYGFSGKSPYHIADDLALQTAIWNVYESILGEKRFETLQKLSRSVQTSEFVSQNGLRSFACTIINPSEQERQILENMIDHLIQRYLSCHGMPTVTLTEWQRHNTLTFPILVVRYAETQKELAVLQALIDSENQKELQQCNTICEDEEADISE